MLPDQPYEIFQGMPFTCFRSVQGSYLYLVHTMPEFLEFYKVLMTKKLVASDTETQGFDWFADHRIVGMSFGWGIHHFYIPVRHEDSVSSGPQPAQLDMNEIKPYLQRFFDRKDVRVVGFNYKFDQHFFKADGIEVNCPVHDVSLLWKLIDENAPGALKKIASGWRDLWGFYHKGLIDSHADDDKNAISEWRTAEAKARKAYFNDHVKSLTAMRAAEIKFQGWKKKDIKQWVLENDLKDHPYKSVKKEQVNYGCVPVVSMTKYAALDTFLTIKLFEILLPKIKENPKLSKLYLNELELAKVLFDAEETGLYVDKAKMIATQIEYALKIRDKEKEVKDKLREQGAFNNPDGTVIDDINLASTDQLIRAFQNMGAELTKLSKSKKKLALDSKVLAKLVRQYPVAKGILELRKLEKLKETYMDGLLPKMGEGNILHPTFNQNVRCMPAGELVLTSRGYINVEDVKVGDSVISHTGTPRLVVDTSHHSPTLIYKVTLANGLSLRTSWNHEYYCKDGSWKQANQLALGDQIVTHSEVEEWREIKGWYPYEISSWGRVRNSKTKNNLRVAKKGRWGHLKICLSRNGAQKRGGDRNDFTIHKLVFDAFGDKTQTGEIRHLNGISWDNNASNLRKGSASENRRDALIHGTIKQKNLIDAGQLTYEDVAYIRSHTPKDKKLARSKLSRNQVAEIKGQPERSVRSLAAEYGLSVQAVYYIRNGSTWDDTFNLGEGSYSYEEMAKKFGVSVSTIRFIVNNKAWIPPSAVTGLCASFNSSEVINIEQIGNEPTYGLTVEIDHSHVTGGIVTHNTGRMSGQNPSTMNLPTKDKTIKGMFITPSDEFFYLFFDYSQVEVRLTGHYSMDPILLDAYAEDLDVHLNSACHMNGLNYAESKAILDDPTHPDHANIKSLRAQGKCVHPDTIICTKEGPRSIGTLPFSEEEEAFLPLEGTSVLDSGGKFVSVNSSYSGKVQPTKLVTTRRGIIACSYNHLFVMADGSLKRAEDLNKGDLLFEEEPQDLYTTSEYPHVQLVSSRRCPKTWIHTDSQLAYLCGLMLGDGTVSDSTLAIAHGDINKKDAYGNTYISWQQQLIKEFEAWGFECTPKNKIIYLGSRQPIDFFRALGIIAFNNKGRARSHRVPQWVMDAGREAFLQFLGGVIDTDGYVSNKGENVDLTSKDPIFIGQLAALSILCGFKLSTQAEYNKTYKKNYYTITYSKACNAELSKYVRHPGKRARILSGLSKIKFLGDSRKPNSVVCVEEYTPTKCVDLNVESPEHLYWTNGLRTHNTLNFAVIYGVSGAGLSEQIPRPKKYADLTDKEWIEVCNDFLDVYLSTHKGVRKFVRNYSKQVEKNGYVENHFGRIRHLPHHNIVKRTGKKDLFWAEAKAKRQGVNFVVQSCQDPEAPVLTTEGYIPLNKLEERNYPPLITYSGVPEDNYVVMDTGLQDSVEVVTDFCTAKCSKNHMYFCYDSASTDLVFKPVSYLSMGDYIVARIDSKNIGTNTEVSEDLAELIGALIGNGSYNKTKSTETRSLSWTPKTSIVGANHPSSKLSQDQEDEVRKLLAEGVSGHAIASKFNVSDATISYIKSGKIRKVRVEGLPLKNTVAKQYFRKNNVSLCCGSESRIGYIEHSKNLINRCFPWANVHMNISKKKDHENVVSLSFENKEAREVLLHHGLDFVSCEDKTIPEWAFTASEPVRLALLKGLFDTDGGVSASAISYTGKSKNVVEGVQLLLTSVGIRSKFFAFDQNGSTYYRTIVHTSYVDRFENLINFRMTHKKAALEKLNRRGIDSIPGALVRDICSYVYDNIGEKRKELSKSEITAMLKGRRTGACVGKRTLLRLLNMVHSSPQVPNFIDLLNLEWVQILSISDIGVMQTLDLSLKGPDHSYICRGLVQHNCAGDVFKMSAVRCRRILRKYKAKTKMVNFVHDEISFFLHKDEIFLIPLLKAAMEDWNFEIPLVADCSISKRTWADKKEIDVSNLTKVYEFLGLPVPETLNSSQNLLEETV